MEVWVIIAILLIGMWVGAELEIKHITTIDDEYNKRLELLEEMTIKINELLKAIENEYESLNRTLKSYKECFDIYGQAYNKLIDENIDLKKRLKSKN